MHLLKVWCHLPGLQETAILPCPQRDERWVRARPVESPLLIGQEWKKVEQENEGNEGNEGQQVEKTFLPKTWMKPLFLFCFFQTVAQRLSFSQTVLQLLRARLCWKTKAATEETEKSFIFKTLQKPWGDGFPVFYLFIFFFQLILLQLRFTPEWTALHSSLSLSSSSYSSFFTSY